MLAVIVLSVVCWLALSVVVFIVSAQTQAGDIPESAQEALDDGGDLLVEPNTILVLGSDQRPKNSKEPGANDAPARADSIMLLRAGGGSSGRLSIPRDTVVDIPEVGPQKVNAAYAIGGPALMIETLRGFLGIDINHLIEVDFENFPKLIDALGGVTWEGKKVCSKVNGGDKNGGVTVNVKKGDELDGRVALALARVRSNDCNPSEDDLDRASRQQQILQAMKSEALSPLTFFRAPFVAWQAPQAIRTDIGPLGLFELAIDVGLGGTPKPRVLKPSGFVDLPDGGQGLAVSDAEVKAAVRQFEGE